MQPSQKSFRTFEDLEVYQVAREFRKAMYGVTRKLPNYERFELASQIRRAAVSLTNNIAEGHGRYHYLEQIKFCLQARGSLEELIDDLNVSHDEQYLSADEVAKLKQEGWRVYQLLNGYIRYLRERKAGASLALHESSPAYGLTDDELDAILNDAPI
ncbi:MAG: four helix bundle protein [Verrucomicrobia bacterium]|nr:four helix bundle protein [Verrucomicrobiota bacterium]